MKFTHNINNSNNRVRKKKASNQKSYKRHLQLDQREKRRIHFWIFFLCAQLRGEGKEREKKIFQVISILSSYSYYVCLLCSFNVMHSFSLIYFHE